jgi:hypothetical protein
LADRDRSVGPAELVSRRDELAAQLVELQWDLGGLVYEMARRDHFRLDVVVSQAAKLQGVDAELGEVERLLHLEQAGAGGTCSACGALHAHGAVYCWQCGADLMARKPAGAEVVSSAGQGPVPVSAHTEQAPSAPPTAAPEAPVADSAAAPARRFAPPPVPEEPQPGPTAPTGTWGV